MDKIVKKLSLLWSKTNRFHRVFLIFLIIELNPFPGGQYGFHCNDPSLSHRYNGDTITFTWLMSMCCLTPLAVMLIVERIYHNSDKDRPNKRAWRWHKEYLFGFLLNLCTVHVIKQIIGSPRPHFFDTCMPNEAKTCEGSEFITSYTCSGEQKRTWDSDRSFPSGHTSLAIYAGFYTIYYLYRRTPSQARARRPAQALSGASAVWCALSRLTDRRHHWWDVAAGTVIGFLSLLYAIHYLCDNFERRSQTDSEVNSNEKNNVPLAKANS